MWLSSAKQEIYSYKQLLAGPKSSFGVFHKVIQKKPEQAFWAIHTLKNKKDLKTKA